MNDQFLLLFVYYTYLSRNRNVIFMLNDVVFYIDIANVNCGWHNTRFLKLTH